VVMVFRSWPALFWGRDGGEALPGAPVGAQSGKDGHVAESEPYNALVQQGKETVRIPAVLSRISHKAKFHRGANTLAAQSGLTVVSMVPDERRSTAAYLEKIGRRIEAEAIIISWGISSAAWKKLNSSQKIINLDMKGSRSIRLPGITVALPAAPVARKPRKNEPTRACSSETRPFDVTAHHQRYFFRIVLVAGAAGQRRRYPAPYNLRDDSV